MNYFATFRTNIEIQKEKKICVKKLISKKKMVDERIVLGGLI